MIKFIFPFGALVDVSPVPGNWLGILQPFDATKAYHFCPSPTHVNRWLGQLCLPWSNMDQLFSGGKVNVTTNINEKYMQILFTSAAEATGRCLPPLQCKHSPSAQATLLLPSANCQGLRMPPWSGVPPLEATPKSRRTSREYWEEESSRGSFERHSIPWWHASENACDCKKSFCFSWMASRLKFSLPAVEKSRTLPLRFMPLKK